MFDLGLTYLVFLEVKKMKSLPLILLRPLLPFTPLCMAPSLLPGSHVSVLLM